MNRFVSITLHAGFILYILVSFPEYGVPDSLIQDTYRWFAFVLTGVLFFTAYESYLVFGAKGFLHAEVLVVTSLVYWLLLDLLQGRYELDAVSAHSVKISFISITIFSIIVLVFSRFSFDLPPIVVRASRSDITPTMIFSTMLICFLLALFYYFKASYFDFQYMLKSLTRARFSSPWARGSAGGLDAILEHLKYFGYVLPALLGLLFLTTSRFDIRRYIAAFLTLFFGAFEFQGGGRRITGFLAGSLIMTILIYKRKDLKIRHFLMVGLAAASLLVLLDMQLAFRNRGYEGMFQKYELENLDEVRVDDNFLRLAQIVDMIPSLYPHSGIQYLTWSFSRPIPRYFWQNKPLGPGFDVASMVGAKGVSLTSTIVGEAYASMGFIMIIFVGILFGFISGTLNNLIDGSLGVLGVALYSVGVLALVGGVRSLPDLIIFSYAFLGILFMYKVFLAPKEAF